MKNEVKKKERKNVWPAPPAGQETWPASWPQSEPLKPKHGANKAYNTAPPAASAAAAAGGNKSSSVDKDKNENDKIKDKPQGSSGEEEGFINL